MVNTMLKMSVGLWMVLAGSLAFAHGAGYEADVNAEVLTLRFFYSVGEPMADTEVIVEDPEGEVWQRGYTDGAGRFSVTPNAHGAWRVVADDGLGHEVVAAVAVSAEGLSAGKRQAQVTVPPLLLFGLLLASVVANVALLLALRGRGSKG